MADCCDGESERVRSGFGVGDGKLAIDLMGGFECVTGVAGRAADAGGEELFDGDRYGWGARG